MNELQILNSYLDEYNYRIELSNGKFSLYHLNVEKHRNLDTLKDCFMSFVSLKQAQAKMNYKVNIMRQIDHQLFLIAMES